MITKLPYLIKVLVQWQLDPKIVIGEYMANLKADINHQGYSEMTPLHIAVENNHLEVIEMLYATYSADIEIRDQQNQTVL
ncbi:hypothetical protein BC936DRAFT_146834 [Jimgerdemannia flammicorona]|uniref:Uncharacterized protein n=1 Tax=Jimgerdemannia flammicorona TaxID=994334 RepID=A0A433D6S0_9FUNG|nr:hypothetical protein BC936DRAFT_146834 [Jimgerdemannia flammicorona]